jgi:protease I
MGLSRTVPRRDELFENICNNGIASCLIRLVAILTAPEVGGRGGTEMRKIFIAFFSFIAFLVFVACGSDPAPVMQPDPNRPLATLPASTLQSESKSQNPKGANGLCEPSGARTCTILYVLSDLYDDEHVLRTRPHFEKAGYAIQVASDTLDVVHGFHECYGHTPASPDVLLGDVNVAKYDAIIIAGGEAYSVVFRYNSDAHRIAREAVEQGKVVAAAGNGPIILAQAGLLEGKTVTVLHDAKWDGLTNEWIQEIEELGANYSEYSPVRDGLLITADSASARFTWDIIEMIELQ